MAGFFAERVSIDTIADWFDEVDQELTSIFTIQKADGNLLTIKDSFKAYYMDKTCRFLKTQETHCNVKFHEIVHKSLFIFKQYEKFKDDLITKLQDFSNYQDEVKTKYSNESHNNNTALNNQDVTNTQTRNLIDGHITGVSDASTMSTIRDKTDKYIETKNMLKPDQDKYLDIIDPNAKNISHTVNAWKGTDEHKNVSHSSSTNTNTNKTGGASEVASSNPFKDMITFMNIDIPDFRGKFLSQFRDLFFLSF